jgi:hypothetical protein
VEFERLKKIYISKLDGTPIEEPQLPEFSPPDKTPSPRGPYEVDGKPGMEATTFMGNELKPYLRSSLIFVPTNAGKTTLFIFFLTKPNRNSDSKILELIFDKDERIK